PKPAAVGHCHEGRAVALRRRDGVRDNRSSPDERSKPVRLQDRGLWKNLEVDRRHPPQPFSYAHCIVEDPVRKGLLYLGTDNPPYGASINYYLAADVSDVQIEIADSTGRSIRTLKGTTQAGVNRVWWDLKYDSTRQPRLRTSPEGHPEIGLQAEGWRPFPFEG